MDVRAVDTSSLAAKRVELENGQHAKDRRVFTLGGITSRTSQESGGQVGRSKSSTERERGQEPEEHKPPEHHTLSETGVDSPDGPPSGTEHILDVKV